MPTLELLNQRYSIPGRLRFEAGSGGLTRCVMAAAGAEAHVYLHGGHVAHYQRRGEPPVLFLSGKSAFADGKPIRGGVPVCFPWFGMRAGHPEAPGHGFARLREWAVESVGLSPAGVALTLLLAWDQSTLAAWPFHFELRHRVVVGPSLSMTLEVCNLGEQAFVFEEALHTYFSVSDARQVKVSGLEGVTYTSKAEGGISRVQEGPITLKGETDRVYLHTRWACVLEDPGLGRRITVEKAGSDATVVWNPWIERAKAIADLGDQEWVGMACIETCNALECAVALPPGQTHAMTAVVRPGPV